MLAALTAVYLASGFSEKIDHANYPRKYREEVAALSAEFDVPWQTVYAVILTESGFRPDAESSAGAVGLMQLMPITFTDIQNRLGESYSAEQRRDPAVNLRCGVYYLSYLYGRFGNWEIVYAAYNAGPTAVAGWLNDPAYAENGVLIHVPYRETEQYIEKVKTAVAAYTALYDAP